MATFSEEPENVPMSIEKPAAKAIRGPPPKFGKALTPSLASTVVSELKRAHVTTPEAEAESKKSKRLHLPRPTVEEREQIQAKIQTRILEVPLGQNDVPGNINWERTTELGKRISLHQRLDFVLKAWDHFELNTVPIILASHDIMTVDGRVFYSSPHWSCPSISPREAMLTNQTYAATLYAKPFIIRTSEIQEYERRGGQYQVKVEALSDKYQKIVELPIPIGSCLCRSYGKTDPDELIRLGICPYAAKGWFIIGGTEFMIRFQEQGRTNTFSIRTGPKLKANRKAQREYVRQARMTYKTPYGSQLVYMFIDKDKSVEVYLSFMKRRWKGQIVGEYMTMPLLSIFRVCQQNFDPYNTITDIANLGNPDNQRKIFQGLIPSMTRIGGIPDDVSYYVSNTQDPIVGGESGKEWMKRRINESLFSFASELSLDERLIQLKVMAAMLIEVEMGLRPEDNPNDWQHKKIVLPSDQMELLFNSYYMRRVGDIQALVLKNSARADKIPGFFDNPADWLTTRIHKCFSTGNWGVDEVWVKSNITMALKVENPVSTWDEMKKINVPTRERNTDLTLRNVRLNQVGFVCTTQTPEGGNCGLVKSMAEMCITSHVSEDFIIRRIIRGEPPEKRNYLINPFAEDVQGIRTFKVLLNGKLLGWVTEDLYFELRSRRRRGDIDRFVSISIDYYDRFIKVYTDGSRPVRPLLIVENQNLIIDQKGLWNASVDELIEKGALEYIDPTEQENAVIAQSIDDLQMARYSGSALRAEILDLGARVEELATKQLPFLPQKLANLTRRQAQIRARFSFARNMGSAELQSLEQEYNGIVRDIDQLQGLIKEHENKKLLLLEKQFLFNKQYVITNNKVLPRTNYTHCEPDPAGTLSISANLVTNAGFDQGARVAFQCKMNTQAMGTASSNYNDNLDTSLRVLQSPKPAIVKTRMTDIIGLNQLPIGDYLMLAIMPWYGYNQEDSLILNKRTLEGGKFDSIKYTTYRYTLSSNTAKGGKDAFYETYYRPINPNTGDPLPWIDDKGYPYRGDEVPASSIIIGVKRIYPNDIRDGKQYEKDVSVKTGFLEQARIQELYFINQGAPDETVIVKTAFFHRPQPGDKFAIPHAQKATFSIAWPADDLPFVMEGPLKGMRPDAIINQHSIPSRMAVGMMWEILMTTLALELGKDMDASAFRPINMDGVRNGLLQFGYHPYGLVNMINGMTGELIPSQIFMGPTMAMALKHLVDQKAQVSSELGRRDPTTLQVVKGRKRGGGMRFGEMERDNFIGHSAPYLLREIFCYSSDPYPAILCESCGALAAINMQTKSGKCKVCGNQENFTLVTLPFVCIDIIQHLAMGNIRLLLRTEPVNNA